MNRSKLLQQLGRRESLLGSLSPTETVILYFLWNRWPGNLCAFIQQASTYLFANNNTNNIKKVIPFIQLIEYHWIFFFFFLLPLCPTSTLNFFFFFLVDRKKYPSTGPCWRRMCCGWWCYRRHKGRGGVLRKKKKKVGNVSMIVWWWSWQCRW